SRSRGFDTWSIERILTNFYHEETRELAKSLNLPPYSNRMTSVMKLLHYWLLHYRVVERDLARFKNSKCLSIHFDEFSRDPEPLLTAVGNAAQIERSKFVFSHLKPVAAGHLPGDPRWISAMESVGFTPQEMRLAGTTSRVPGSV
ncbi:MAG: hypothetical protein ACO1RT_08985, partial [Planctomycetaceae bacterium]